jgi:formylglycine-generating enzyme required for sulfatase activity
MKLTRMTLWLGVAMAIISTASATVPVVTNVVASQRTSTKLVDIDYDVSDAEGDLLKISVEVSHSGGQTFNIPSTSFTGDYGDNIITGANKHIVWDAGKDWDGEYSTQMVIKVTASDARGLPGLQWGNEVPSGGFLMGQEGGAEGYGPSRHVNIPWSYWMCKFEITSAQYSEYLNIALAAGKVRRDGTTGASGLIGVSSNKTLVSLDATRDVLWNVNAFEPVPGRSNFPVRVTWYGAIAFAQFYGYDLPTDAEWEKAARGPDHAGVDQHQAYPWGNVFSNQFANCRTSGDPYEEGSTPVGYYDGNQIPIGPNMANGYGLYDMSGNAYEWTRTVWFPSVENYPQLETLTNTYHDLSWSSDRVIRGGSFYSRSDNIYEPKESLMCYYRKYTAPQNDIVSPSTYGGYENRHQMGFRVIRRSP